MRQRLLTILLLTLLIPAMASAKVGISIGMRDTHYANISATYNQHFRATYEQSLFSEKMGCQYMRVYLGYSGSYSAFRYGITPFYGMAFNNMFSNFGVLVDGQLKVYKPLSVYSTLCPLYDTTFKYKLCYKIGAQADVTHDIGIRAALTTIPEYRQSERRAEWGITLNSGQLSVTSMLSTLIEGKNKLKTIRVNVSFAYQF